MAAFDSDAFDTNAFDENAFFLVDVAGGTIIVFGSLYLRDFSVRL